MTGIGIVNPLGTGVEPFWSRLLAGARGIGRIRRFDPEGLPVTLAAEVEGFSATTYVPKRLAVKSDRFAHYALAASSMALADAGLDLDREDRSRVGISFGNNSGGWDICGRGFDEYYGDGPTMVNPWQATAWFPTAPQGFVSIQYGIRGYSKSFACDRASGASGLYFGLRSVRWGYNDVVLCGGSEAPLTRLGVASHVSNGELSRSSDASGAYLPFAAARSGLVLGEGSTVLVVEERERARRRGAPILGEVRAVEQRTGRPGDPATLERATRAALVAGGVGADELDLLLPEGCGTPDGDRAEAAALHQALGAAAARVPCAVPKAAYGHQYGASAVTELACGLLAGRDRVVPPTVSTDPGYDACGLRLLGAAQPTDVHRILVTAGSREGTAAAVVATAGDVERAA